MRVVPARTLALLTAVASLTGCMAAPPAASRAPLQQAKASGPFPGDEVRDDQVTALAFRAGWSEASENCFRDSFVSGALSRFPAAYDAERLDSIAL